MKLMKRLRLLGLLCVLLASAQEPRWQHHIKAGNKAFKAHHLDQAEKHFKAALQDAERFGPRDRRLPESLDNLAEVYHARGKYELAESLYQRSLAIREQILGPWHLDVARSLDNLADLYGVQGKTAQAEPLHQRSRTIREKALAEHPDVYVDGKPQPPRVPQ